ncbi:MAG: potassium channel family protein [Candidatus Didemnitutus sp.]|nr:potassium channel family protein [Candidatus Didemnitutus sp.]
MNDPHSPAEEIGPFQIVILVLSLLVLATLLVDAAFDLPTEISRLLQIIDDVICVVLFVDVVLRFRRARSKRRFLRWGWLDLVACIPHIDALRVARLVRVAHVIRVLRDVRMMQRIVSGAFQHRVRGGFAAAGLTVALLISFSSVAILAFERREPEANIVSAEDAIWWSAETLTTVGYGDRFPVTGEGRVLAVSLMLCGIGLFGTISGITASFLLGARADDAAPRELTEAIARLQAEVTALREAQEARAAENRPPPSL